jgi:hypothetical protein
VPLTALTATLTFASYHTSAQQKSSTISREGHQPSKSPAIKAETLQTQNKMSEYDNANPMPAISFHPDRMVTLLVGPEQQEMVAHDEHLSRDSAFLRAEMMKHQHQRNGHKRVINLEKESPALVQLYIAHVVYGGKLQTHDVTGAPEYTPNRYQYTLLAQLYVLGERLLNAVFQNTIIREIVRLSHLQSQFGPLNCRHYPSSGAVDTIYRGTTSQSPARRLMVDFATSSCNEDWIGRCNFDPDADFWRDFGKALLRKTLAQRTIRDFRNVHLNAADYLVSEYPLPQNIPGT